jgi:hypothetical protein
MFGCAHRHLEFLVMILDGRNYVDRDHRCSDAKGMDKKYRRKNGRQWDTVDRRKRKVKKERAKRLKYKRN